MKMPKEAHKVAIWHKNTPCVKTYGGLSAGCDR